MGSLYVAGEKPTAAILNQYYGFADTTATTVTAATQTRLTTSYSIPANEPSVGSAYEIRFGGSGTWGSTAESLTFGLFVGSVQLFANILIGSLAFNTSAAFRFSGQASIVWNATGASGNVLGSMIVDLTETANNIQAPATYSQTNWGGNASWSIADANAAASSAIDTTAAQAFVVKCAWGSTTGSPTITNRHTIWKKTA